MAKKARFKKGSKAAKDYMAKIRAKRGKKTRRKTTKKTVTRVKNPAKVKTRKATARSSFFFVFKCKGYDVWYLSMMASGKFRWFPTRGDALRFPTQKLAARVAGMLAKRLSEDWLVYVAPDRMTHSAIVKQCQQHANPKRSKT